MEKSPGYYHKGSLGIDAAQARSYHPTYPTPKQ